MASSIGGDMPPGSHPDPYAMPALPANLIYCQNMACMAMMQVQQWESYSAKLTQKLNAINRRRELAAKAAFAKRILGNKFPGETASTFSFTTTTRVKAPHLTRLPHAPGSAPSGGAVASSAQVAPSAAASEPSAHAHAHQQQPQPSAGAAGPADSGAVAQLVPVPNAQAQAPAGDSTPPAAGGAAAEAQAQGAAAAAAADAPAGAPAAAGVEGGAAAGNEAGAAGQPGAARAPPRENAWVRHRLGAILKLALLLLVFEVSTVGLFVYFYGALLYMSGMFDGIIRQFFNNNFPPIEEQLHNIRDMREPQEPVNVENRPGPVWRALYQSVFMFFVTLAPWWNPDPRYIVE